MSFSQNLITIFLAAIVLLAAFCRLRGWFQIILSPFSHQRHTIPASTQPRCGKASYCSSGYTFAYMAGRGCDSSQQSLIELIRFEDDNPKKFGLRRHSKNYTYTSISRPTVLEDTVIVTSSLFPSVFEAATSTISALNITSAPEFYIRPSPYTQATCAYLGDECPLAVVLHSGLIELLTSEELRFVIGHEMGHFLFKHYEYSLNSKDHCSAPLLHAYNAWQRATEISADRAGLVCAGSEAIAISAMLKSASGLSSRHVRIDSLAFQHQAIKSEMLGNTTASLHSHPPLPLRARAIHLFSKSRSCPPLIDTTQMGTRTKLEVDSLIREELAAAGIHYRDSPAAEEIASRAMLWSLLIYFFTDGAISHDEKEVLEKFTSSSDAAKAISFVYNYGINAAKNKHNDAIYRLCMITMDERKAMLHKMNTVLHAASTDHAAVESFILSLRESIGIS